MKMKVFAVFDQKVSAYMNPFFMRTAGEAVRGFEEIANDGKSQISRFPADFVLFELAEFDDLSGKLLPHPAPISLGVAVELKKPVTPTPMFSGGAELPQAASRPHAL